MIELALGGARSGKSAYAERSALAKDATTYFYLATASALDTEMAARIAHHQSSRDPRWQLVEAPLQLADALASHCSDNSAVVVDCLTLWMTNLLLADGATFNRERAALLEVLPHLPGHIWLVSNETGMGIVPLDALTRRFVDETGRLHQQLAGLCHRVTLLVAGIPVTVKDAQI
jgi:adenosylcobinamide kinase / adenosylcobinamide-phosphate guanylyltransferase